MSWPADEISETSTTPVGAVENATEEVLVVSWDPETRVTLQRVLFVGERSTTTVSSPDEAVACLSSDQYSACVVSVDTPEALTAIQAIRSSRSEAVIVAYTQLATPELVRDVMRVGADDILIGKTQVKSLPARIDELTEAAKQRLPAAALVEGATSCETTATESQTTTKGASSDQREPVDLVCHDDKMRRVLSVAKKIAPTNSTVLIQGESGTGKELIARWVHQHSERADRVFVEVNCGALPENLLESQLFGHEKGSFTGAMHRQLGLFEVADGGTIFLDEIGEMSPDMQVKLLRVLQSREFRRVGGSQVVKVDVRVIAATNRDLKSDVDDGRFRGDLYYRLNVIGLELPPLRERLEEIPHLVGRFCAKFGEEKGLPLKEFTADAMRALQRYRWEGNIRELENAVERLVLLSAGDRIDVDEVEENLSGQSREVATESPFSEDMSLDDVKQLHIAKVLKANDGNKMRSARILKINVKTLYNLIKNLDIKF